VPAVVRRSGRSFQDLADEAFKEVEELRCDPPESQEQRRALNGADITI
jgi:hypothetical protein